MTSVAGAVQSPTGSRAGLRLGLKVIAGLFAAAFIAAGALALLNLMARHTFTAQRSYVGVRSLSVDSDNGNVRLLSAPRGAPLGLVERVTEDLQTPRRTATLGRSGQLELHGHCNFLMSIECSVAYSIAVPAGVGVRVNSGAGDLDASGLTATAPITLASGAGNVTARGISAPSVHLDTGAGDITAQLSTAPRDLEASSGAGNITITVPNVPYDVSASSGAGNVSDNGLRIDKRSPHRINVSAGAGDVTISVGR